MSKQYIKSWVDTNAGKVPVITGELDFQDKLGALRVRLSILRMSYMVSPGLYAIGNPNRESTVFVSANFKLSFDMLRRELKDIDTWILVLDTKGINVWCAAGKGMFGTQELVTRIKATDLEKIVNHRKLIVPQLGATGISAHEVKKLSGFSVIFGPVRVMDIPAFLNAGLKATQEMRRVNFTFYDRFVLIPVEIVGGVKYLLFITALFYLLSGLNRNGYSDSITLNYGSRSIINLLFVYIGGTVAGPLLLPWLHGRSFAMKGFSAGLVFFVILYFLKLTGRSVMEIISWVLIIPAVSSFILLNFTGASTYTSISGVRKEMRIAIPLQAAAVVAGLVIWIISRFV
jgi:acetyl-CoA decarbonylase/synthase complex subunit gamma